MHYPQILSDLAIIFAVASAVLYLCYLLKFPALVGQILAGVLVGPLGLRLVSNSSNVQLLAEIGISVLLFTVGLEFSTSRLSNMWRLLLLCGLPQFMLTIIATFIFSLLFLFLFQLRFSLAFLCACLAPQSALNCFRKKEPYTPLMVLSPSPSFCFKISQLSL